ncbi:MAG: YHS domain-containing protein [Saprospiraceae bacterium]|jgi:YHS domain-containing protein|nr:YHS domain-containing protein [Saprospiraceae bacterium]
MKKIIAIALAITAFISCQNQPKPATEGHVHFANKTDYICGMEVQADWTDTTTYAGKTYAFCAASCKEEFLKYPEKYLAAK